MSHASLGSFQQWRGFRSWAVRICLPQAGPDREIGKYKKERHNSWGEGENAAYPIGDVFRPDVSQLAVTSGLLPQSQGAWVSVCLLLCSVLFIFSRSPCLGPDTSGERGAGRLGEYNVISGNAHES